MRTTLWHKIDTGEGAVLIEHSNERPDRCRTFLCRTWGALSAYHTHNRVVLRTYKHCLTVDVDVTVFWLRRDLV